MKKVRQDTLRVQNYKDRVVVDLDADDRSEDFVQITNEGISFHMGVQKSALTWNAADQLIDSLIVGRSVYKPK